MLEKIPVYEIEIRLREGKEKEEDKE